MTTSNGTSSEFLKAQFQPEIRGPFSYFSFHVFGKTGVFVVQVAPFVWLFEEEELGGWNAVVLSLRYIYIQCLFC